MKILVLFLLFLLTNLASAQDSQTAFENGLRSKIYIDDSTNQKMNLLQRMKDYNVPGLSIAVINNGRIEWAKGYGHSANTPNSSLINTQTLFQAGSISKVFTAFGALILVQRGKIDLDADVNLYLKRWKIPENEFTKTEKVTLRRLLSHTAGTTVHGFDGYSTTSSIPNIVDILEGKKPAVNSAPVRVTAKPGSEQKYSGGGTTIVQLLIEDITSEPFDLWMQNNVLKPLGMLESTFIQPLPLMYERHAAQGHYLNGAPVVGKWHLYPEMGAAGLWSTPKDLAQLILYIQAALKGEKTSPLQPAYVKQMITRQKVGDQDGNIGLGLFLDNEGKDLMIWHGGQDEGFIARLSGYPFLNQGVVIMMNNDSGWSLMDELTNSLADTYHWPGFEPVKKSSTAITPLQLRFLPGLYLAGEEKVEIILKDSKLWIDFKNKQGPMELYSAGKCQFFLLQEVLTIEFLNCTESPKSLTITDAKGIKKVYKRG